MASLATVNPATAPTLMNALLIHVLTAGLHLNMANLDAHLGYVPVDHFAENPTLTHLCLQEISVVTAPLDGEDQLAVVS